ncbi:MAG: L-rhamnose isomerase, partial [Draconibacterium sp.]|nr:L-rhamnose isomerase [Draconibacterium sp.]
MNKQRIEQAYQLAKEQYAELGVNTDAVLERMNEVAISLH